MIALVVAGAGLHEVLVERAVAWARSLAADVAVVGSDEDAARAAEAAAGPVVVVWADTPRLGPVHAAGVRGDLEAGADLVAAPSLDGCVYLLAMREGRAALVGPPFARVLELATEHALEIGMLRHERRLRRPEDVRALLADPLIAPEVRAALTSG